MISTYVNQKVIVKVMDLCTYEYIEKSSFLKDIVRTLDKITLVEMKLVMDVMKIYEQKEVVPMSIVVNKLILKR